jgi:hypothetical protein
MRPSRRLGGVVLLLLSTSGCAAVQSRFNGPAPNPEEAAPSRSSGWFGSRFWSRPTPTSASTAAGNLVTPEVETARPTAPDTDIWPVPRSSSGLSRLFPMLGSRDSGKTTVPAGDIYPSLASLSTPAATPEGSNDLLVRPESGDEAPKGVASRQQPARAKAASTAKGDVPELLPGPTAVQVPVKRHDRPEFRGAVALEVEPASLDERDETNRGPFPQDVAVGSTPDLPEIGRPAPAAPARNRPRREAYVIATAAGADDLITTGGDEPATPSASSPQPASTAVSQQPKPTIPKAPETAPSTTPSAGPPPSPLAPSMPSAGPPPPPLGPPTSPPPATDSAPVTPRAPTTSLPATSPVPAPVAEPVPTVEPGPKAAPSMLEATPPVAAVPAPTAVPAAAGLAIAASQAPAPAAISQGSPALAQPAPSPQTSVHSAGSPAKPPHKSCWLLNWIHSLHQPAPQPKCQLPPATFPSTYQTCMPGPRPTRPTVAGLVQAAPQSPRVKAPPPCTCTAKSPKASCFSWFHYGMASDFFAKVRTWRHGCACHCHDSQFRLWWGTCKRCASKSGGPTAPLASPQASSSPVLPQSQSGLSSWSPVPRDFAESNQVLERIATQGLDKTP